MAAIRIRGGAEAVAVIGSLPQHCNSQADRSACGRIALTARQCCADDTPHPLSLLRDSDPGVPTPLPPPPPLVAARPPGPPPAALRDDTPAERHLGAPARG